MGAPGATFPPRSTSYGRRGRQADALCLDHRSAPRAYPLLAADGAGPSGGQARSLQPPVQYDLDKKIWAMLGMGHAKKLTQKPVWSRTPTLRTYEQQVRKSRGHTKPRRSSRCYYSGRTEAASGLPVGQIPEEARLPEATLGKPTVRRRRAPGKIQRVHAIRCKRA